jgi:hypothetical protein
MFSRLCKYYFNEPLGVSIEPQWLIYTMAITALSSCTLTQKKIFSMFKKALASG